MGRSAMTTLTATTWRGPAPRPGMYLKADRGRTAYEITAVRELPRGTLGTRRYRFAVRRLAATDLPTGATVIEWVWNHRPRAPSGARGKIG